MSTNSATRFFTPDAPRRGRGMVAKMSQPLRGKMRVVKTI